MTMGWGCSRTGARVRKHAAGPGAVNATLALRQAVAAAHTGARPNRARGGRRELGLEARVAPLIVRRTKDLCMAVRAR
jgi:hypothetical protein